MEIAKAAEAYKLERFYDLSLLDNYAKAYGKLPREVAQERFDDFMPYLLLWKEQGEYYERYEAQKKFLTGDGNGNTKK